MSPEAQFSETTTRFGVLQLDVEVREGAIGVRCLPVQRSFTWYPVREVDDVRVAGYSAREHGGWHWGVRVSPRGSTVYRLKGDRGVSLTLADGRRIFVGSQRAHELRDAVVNAR